MEWITSRWCLRLPFRRILLLRRTPPLRRTLLLRRTTLLRRTPLLHLGPPLRRTPLPRNPILIRLPRPPLPLLQMVGRMCNVRGSSLAASQPTSGRPQVQKMPGVAFRGYRWDREIIHSPSSRAKLSKVLRACYVTRSGVKTVVQSQWTVRTLVLLQGMSILQMDPFLEKF